MKKAYEKCRARGGMLLSEWARAHHVGRKHAKTLLRTGHLRGYRIRVGRHHYYCVHSR